MTDLEKINAYVESHRDEMLETYRKVILQESYHSAPEEVRTMGKMFKEMFEEVGFRCKLTNVGTDESGDMLTGILGEDRPGKPSSSAATWIPFISSALSPASLRWTMRARSMAPAFWT